MNYDFNNFFNFKLCDIKKLDKYAEKKTNDDLKLLDNDKFEENFDIPTKKQNFNWFKYIWYKICCGRNNSKIQYYDDFRKQIISEENILQYHLDIYKLLKACNIEKNPPVPQNNPEKREESI